MARLELIASKKFIDGRTLAAGTTPKLRFAKRWTARSDDKDRCQNL
jgi:hypothetical protein